MIIERQISRRSFFLVVFGVTTMVVLMQADPIPVLEEDNIISWSAPICNRCGKEIWAGELVEFQDGPHLGCSYYDKFNHTFYIGHWVKT
jgi:hypothetical protein